MQIIAVDGGAGVCYDPRQLLCFESMSHGSIGVADAHPFAASSRRCFLRGHVVVAGGPAPHWCGADDPPLRQRLSRAVRRVSRLPPQHDPFPPRLPPPDPVPPPPPPPQ